MFILVRLSTAQYNWLGLGRHGKAGQYYYKYFIYLYTILQTTTLVIMALNSHDWRFRNNQRSYLLAFQLILKYPSSSCRMQSSTTRYKQFGLRSCYAVQNKLMRYVFNQELLWLWVFALSCSQLLTQNLPFGALVVAMQCHTC